MWHEFGDLKACSRIKEVGGAKVVIIGRANDDSVAVNGDRRTKPIPYVAVAWKKDSELCPSAASKR